jgi:hypothetical protein
MNSILDCLYGFFVIKGCSIRRMSCDELGLTLFNLELYFTLSFGWTLREECVCVLKSSCSNWRLGTINLKVKSCWCFEWRSREGFLYVHKSA